MTRKNQNALGSRHKTHPRLASHYRVFMLGVGLAYSAALLLQILTMIDNESSHNVSFTALVLYTVIAGAWLGYGLLWSDVSVVFLSSLATVTAVCAVVVSTSFQSSLPPGAFTT